MQLYSICLLHCATFQASLQPTRGLVSAVLTVWLLGSCLPFAAACVSISQNAIEDKLLTDVRCLADVQIHVQRGFAVVADAAGYEPALHIISGKYSMLETSCYYCVHISTTSTGGLRRVPV